MCMMCEEQAMYQAYLGYLARKAKEKGAALTPEERAFLLTGGFACDPTPADDAGGSPEAPEVA